MSVEPRPVTAGKAKFFQDEERTRPLFCIEPGMDCQLAREQASELLDYVQEMTIAGLLDEKPKWVWAAYHLSGLAKALLDDAELGEMAAARSIS